MSYEAGRPMLDRLQEHFESQESFALETTLASKIYKQKILFAQENKLTSIGNRKSENQNYGSGA
ncbi:hypothetical protein [Lacihabitans sp. LS3-19]|uniref:hypothetical protein n=1 Tax=Lacihabitans sp. LS3-19 TaxID=2487335 RepID=UPI0020CF299F|nr:hypothetical protein [Lacihabitans sp. LS3-19]